jgi:hypothetical protein
MWPPVQYCRCLNTVFLYDNVNKPLCGELTSNTNLINTFPRAMLVSEMHQDIFTDNFMMAINLYYMEIIYLNPLSRGCQGPPWTVVPKKKEKQQQRAAGHTFTTWLQLFSGMLW